MDDEIIIISSSPTTDSTRIVQNFSMSTSSSIALQVINLDPNYYGTIYYDFYLYQLIQEDEITYANTLYQGIEDVDGPNTSDTSPVVIFTELSSDYTYTAQCVIWYNDGLGDWMSEEINCTLGTSAYEPDFSDIEIEIVEVTDTSCVVALTNLDENYSGEMSIQWRVLYDTGNIYYIKTTTQSGGVVTSDEIELPNLSPDTSYVIYAQLTYYVNGESNTESTSIICTTETGETGEWEIVYQKSLSKLEDMYEYTRSYNEGDVVRFEFDCKYSGLAEFYTTGNVDTIGYLGTSTSFNESTGKPKNPLESNDNGGDDGNFWFTYDVEAGERYYVWVRCKDISDSGKITFCIIPPESGSGGGDIGGDEDDWLIYDNTELVYDISGDSIRVSIDNFNMNYQYVVAVEWVVTCDNTNEEILNVHKYSDEDDDYYYLSFDFVQDYQYHVYAHVIGRPDTINPETWDGYISIIIASPNWAVYHIKDYSNISETKSLDLSLGEGQVNQISITFQSNGKATFYSEGSLDVKGYFGTDSRFDTSQGFPYDYNKSDNDSGGNGNFWFECDVEAGEVYYLWVRCYKKTYSGVTTIYIEPPISVIPRPDYFEWTYPKIKGEEFNLKALEWCNLLDNINEVRVYKGYNEIPEGTTSSTDYYKYFTYPDSGDIFRYQHYNQALNAITGMLGTGYNDNAVKKGDPVTAAKINLLVSWLNGIT